MNGKIPFYALLILLAAASVPCRSAEEAGQETKLLLDFETQQELDRWKPRGVDAVLSGEHVTHGKKSVQLTYKAGGGLKIFMFEAGKKKFDLSGYSYLLIDYYAPVNMEVTVKLKSGWGKAKWQQEYSLEPAPDILAIPIGVTGLDPSAIDYINFFVGSPGTDTVLYLDNIRAIKGRKISKKPPKPEKPDDELF